MSIELVNVGVAQLKIASSPVILRTILGSCVGICIYDRNKKIGGLAHILLSKSTNPSQPEKFADTAIPALIDQLLKQGCRREFMSAKIAGGASMFKFTSQTPLGLIGEHNVAMTKKVLEEKKIPLLSEDTGGSSGRVIDFYLEDGRLKVKAGGHEEYYYKV
ncbi:MAG: chemotaxis protein CheD [Spirochaetes bacterium]|jgi:chemotaxis protein CheD|nr:chemotaxis protein CheD [Spirochaetota bacterium]